MLKYLKSKLDFGTSSEDGEEVLAGHTLFRLMRHFPVAAKIQYYPEYKKDILLDSVVLAYVINDDFIYSTANLVCHGKPGILEFDDQGKHFSFDRITRFRIVLPIFNKSETKLDYFRREELLKVGGLVKGNVITLKARQESGLVPVLETLVEKRTVLKEGFYAKQSVVYLDVNVDSLMLSDQRAHLRLSTNVPVTIQISKKDEYALLNCTMRDFSDRSLRLQVDNDFVEDAMPKEKDILVVSFNLPGKSEYISLVGEIYRLEDKVMVVMLTGFIEKGQTVRLGQIDILKIKANLLQHTSTHLAIS